MRPIILSVSGIEFDFTNPKPHSIHIDDIATSLANICRFNGQINHHYSVAQHSILVAMLVPRELKFAALMHDAHEAYVGDVASPLKALLLDYQRIEERVQGVVRARFGLPASDYEGVKKADYAAFLLESAHLREESDTFVDETEGSEIPYQFNSFFVHPWTPLRAEQAFLESFAALKPKGVQ